MFIDEDDVLYVTDSTSNARNNPGFDPGIYIGSAVDGTVHAYIPDPDIDRQDELRILGGLGHRHRPGGQRVRGRRRPAADPEIRQAAADCRARLPD